MFLPVNTNVKTFDVLIIGSGISGLSYAFHLLDKNPNLHIAIITKSNEDETNTKYAQGGIAVVLEKSAEARDKHIQDTLTAGCDMCDEPIVKMVVESGYDRLHDLVRWGVRFDKDKHGKFDLHLEGGHTEKRIVHHKDATGMEIECALLSHLKNKFSKQIEIRTHHIAIDILKTAIHGKEYCCGALVLDIEAKQCIRMIAKTTLICTGGIGEIYSYTTNSFIATGDGIGLAYRAGLAIEQMAFIQFHPTALYEKDKPDSFLLSEAMRGKGGHLLNAQKERFMINYDKRGELAPRDIVSRAIEQEKKNHNTPFVYLDMTMFAKSDLEKSFPQIYSHLASKNIYMEKDLIPVTPAAHYLCGGIRVNADAQTSLENLFSVGECSCTGLHGANRLASNSLLEAIVFAFNAAMKTDDLLQAYQHISFSPITLTFPLYTISTHTAPSLSDEIRHRMQQTRKAIQELLSTHVGVIRKTSELYAIERRLHIFLSQIQQWKRDFSPTLESIELENICITALLVVKNSIEQKENRGTFFNIDFSIKK